MKNENWKIMKNKKIKYDNWEKKIKTEMRNEKKFKKIIKWKRKKEGKKESN